MWSVVSGCHFWPQIDREILVTTPGASEAGSDHIGAPVFQRYGTAKITFPILSLFPVLEETHVISSRLVAPGHDLAFWNASPYWPEADHDRAKKGGVEVSLAIVVRDKNPVTVVPKLWARIRSESNCGHQSRLKGARTAYAT